MTDDSVTPEYLAWLASIAPREGVGGNEAWNAGVAYARALAAVPASHPVERVELYGVKDGKETLLGTVPMPPRMKAREITRQTFGHFEDDDGSDAEMCFGALEQMIDHMMAIQDAAPIAQQAGGVPAGFVSYAIDASDTVSLNGKVTHQHLVEDEYTIDAERADCSEDWYINMRHPDGCHVYDGYWRNSSSKTADEVVQEAIRGACLPPPLSQRSAAAQ